MTDTDTTPAFEGWAILELMGHRRLAGRVSEATIGGGSFLRLDVPGENGDMATQFYSPSAVYCITPTTEDIARAVAKRCAPTPVTRYEIPEVSVVRHDADYEDEDYD